MKELFLSLAMSQPSAVYGCGGHCSYVHFSFTY